LRSFNIELEEELQKLKCKMKEVERQRDEAEEKNEILNQDKQIFTVLEESVS